MRQRPRASGLVHEKSRPSAKRHEFGNKRTSAVSYRRTLGGGYGPLTPHYGLALDNLLGTEVALADGRLVYCDEHQNPDLFWALRGGGGNFGVVTSMRVQLHPIR